MRSGETVASMDACCTDVERATLDWAGTVVEALANVGFDGEPIRVRRALRRRAHELAQLPAWKPRCYLLLLFGSVARAEASSDIDLVVVAADAHVGHVYRRIRCNGRSVDFNLVNETWLRDAWRDVEHGYWLNESYVLDASDDELVAAWKQSCNLYWSAASSRTRRSTHRAMTLRLLDAHRLADNAGLPLVSRLLGHEAALACGCLLIDRLGSRVFSRRSFLGELRALADEMPHAGATLSSLMTHLLPSEHGSDETFVALSRTISTLLRDDAVASLIGLDRASTRTVRVDALSASVRPPVGPQLERTLEGSTLDAMLPSRASLAGLASTIEALVDEGVHAYPVPLLRQQRLSTEVVPRRGDIAGARWVSCDSSRLKIVVDTGGCKTASCAFCALPAFGRSTPRASVAAALEQALERYHPREVALYNDGSLLNPREVQPGEWLSACDVLRRHRIRRLTIESIPRFVTRRVVADVLARSGVGELAIAMGLQCVDNAFAVARLGRPDVDALFDFAIDEVHEARATVRLYLLWGYGPTPLAQWSDRVERSIEWARERDVEKISVCPYVSPVGGGPRPGDWERALKRLQRRVRRSASPETVVEILEQGLESCAFKGAA